jgi:RNA polymerase sigma factor (sigma-70 family)
VEASALPTRSTAGRAPFSAAFLRLRSDDQLVALFRAGSDDAFRTIHERYGGRLLAYTRQMLRGGAGDPEDALQDVFMRAYRSLRSSNRPVILRAWLYRIAHNRCIDEIRRPCPLPSELAADAEPAFGAPAASREPAAIAERSAALARLVADVRTLPAQQRSALLMRELQGLRYEEIAEAMAISVGAVKSLLLRARTGLIEVAVARDTPCVEIRGELVCAADRGVRISGRARRHCRECTTCEDYRGELKRLRRGFAALAPSGPLAQLGMLLGIGSGSGAAAAGGSGGAAAAGGAGGAAAAGGGTLTGLTAAKIAVAVCCAALVTTAGRAVIAPSSKPAQPLRTFHASTVSAASNTTPSTPSRTSAAAPVPARQPAAAGAGGGPAHAGGGAAFVGATGSTGATAADGSAGVLGTTAATGATGPIAGATGATGATGGAGAAEPGGDTSATPAVAVNGIGGSGASNADSDPPSLPAATGSTGAIGPPAGPDQHFDAAKSGSPTGSSGASGPIAAAAAAAS